MGKKSDKRSKKSQGKSGSAEVDAADSVEAPEAMDPEGPVELRPRELLRLPEGAVTLAQLSTERLPGMPADKAEAAELMAEMAPRLAEMQEKLFAASTAGDRRRVLLVLQGMDAAGKDGVIKHAMGLFDPAGVALTSFKKPTADELEHDFLWRIERQVPVPGTIGVFNRSQYEDVLIARVHDLVPKAVWSKRYAQINAFERKVARSGVIIVKCFLHVSYEVQGERLEARLDDPSKHWKFNPADIDERAYWDAYQEAYRVALTRCSTTVAPWFVIPSDHKWYRNWAVAALLLETLEAMDLHYPSAPYDVAKEKIRLAAQSGT
ncbi:MAG: polyphosphate kinase 2 family protein [Nakamurella sp.]